MKTHGISPLNSGKYPHEYYRLTDIAKATGFSPTHLRACPLLKWRFGNADYLKVKDINSYIQNPSYTEPLKPVVTS